MLVLAPIACICAGIAVSSILERYYSPVNPVTSEDEKEPESENEIVKEDTVPLSKKKEKKLLRNPPRQETKASKKERAALPPELGGIVTIGVAIGFLFFVWHCTWVALTHILLLQLF